MIFLGVFFTMFSGKLFYLVAFASVVSVVLVYFMIPRLLRRLHRALSTAVDLAMMEVERQARPNGAVSWLRAASQLVRQLSTSAGKASRGIWVAASERALAGSGWVSMKRPLAPAASAAFASMGTYSRWPPDLPPPAPGSWTLWVASIMVGVPHLAMMAK